MARHRKATMSSRLDRRRAGPSRVLIGGWRVTSLRRRTPQKGQAEEPHCRRGSTGAGRTGRKQPSRHIPGHPRWPFSCTSVWPHRRIARRDIDLRARRCNGDPPALFNDAGVPQRVDHRFIPGDAIRRRNGNGPPPRPGCRGADPILSGELDAGPSDPFAGTLAEIARVPDRDGFPRKSASYRQAGTSC
ncbi:hypothetical protein ACVWXN_000033 [Bradyrhizobium sp. i1.4.4]